MGIKFYCPNGHKLNVKSFLSGKRAICPKCGARVQVPSLEESTVVGSDSVPEIVNDFDVILEANDELQDLTAETVHSTGSITAGAVSTAAPPAAPLDAIAEAPTAVWYVRPATGSQFGPASGDIMRAWLNEGRVGSNSLVWRAGWPEWRAAAAVFPQLGGQSAAGGAAFAPAQAVGGGATYGANGPVGPVGGGLPLGQVVQNVAAGQEVVSATSSEVPPLAASVRRKRRQNDARLIASAVLFVLSIILMIILAIVWQRQGAAETTPPSQPTPAANEPTT